MTATINVADIQYLSEKAIRREVRRSEAWVKAHAPLMPGCDFTPAGHRRVPRVCVLEFIKNHQPSTCPACGNSEAEALRASASSGR